MIPAFVARLPRAGRLPLFASLIGMVLVSPSLLGELATEDHHFKRRALELELPWEVNLYGHQEIPKAATVVEANQVNRVLGDYPWLTSEDFGVSFWRPLASLTHHLDYRVLSEWPALMHLHSVLWYGLLVAAVAVFYRRLLGASWVAGVAALMYAVDDAHGHPVGWLANRNGVMATLFGVMAIMAHHRARTDGSRLALVLSPIWLALGLLSGEFALGAVGFFVAHAVCLDDAPPLRRLLGQLPWVVTVAGWAVAYRALGHTAAGSGLYLSPLSVPLLFLEQAFGRGVVLLTAAVATPPSDLWRTLEGTQTMAFVAFGLLVLAVVGRALWPLLREERWARFCVLGTLLCLPPACATFPEDRLLFFAGLGTFPLVAAVVERAFRGVPPRASGIGAWTARGFVVLHGVIPLGALPYRSLHMHRYDAELRQSADQLAELVRDPELDALVVINTPDFYYASMVTTLARSTGRPWAHRVIAFAGSPKPVYVRVLDAHTVQIRPQGGFLSRPFNRIYRSPNDRFTVGQRTSLYGVEITITEVDATGQPLTAEFRFLTPLTTDNLRWAAWKNGRFVPFAVPEVGRSVVVSDR